MIQPAADIPLAVAIGVAFFLLLGITWMFRNAGHTLMTGSDTVEHGHGKHRASGHETSAGGTGPGH